jgi:nicotinamide-nucleotide amidase
VSETRGANSFIVTVGEELLSGETVETNGSWLSKQLASLGVPVTKRVVVGDDPESIQTAVSEGLCLADIVLVTGGLGPTADDLTRPAIAHLFGLRLEVDQAVLADLRERFRARGFDDFPTSNVVQAEVPRGAAVIPNTRGSAPGLWIEREEQIVVLMPGVPREVYQMYEAEVQHRIRAHLGARVEPWVHRTFHTTGIAESVLGEHLDVVAPELPEEVSLASLPYLGGVSIRISTLGSQDLAGRRLDDAERVIGPILAPFRFEAESGDLVEAVTAELNLRELSLAVAESCTGGLLAKRITDRAGSSEYFRGGVVAYVDEIKRDALGVDGSVIEAEGAVSEAVAAGLARGVAERFGADVGVGITGVAGPGGGTEEKPVGSVWYGVFVKGRIETKHRMFPGDREAVRERAAQAALHLLLRILRERR